MCDSHEDSHTDEWRRNEFMSVPPQTTTVYLDDRTTTLQPKHLIVSSEPLIFIAIWNSGYLDMKMKMCLVYIRSSSFQYLFTYHDEPIKCE